MDTRENIRQIVQEWAEFDIPEGYPRALDLPSFAILAL